MRFDALCGPPACHHRPGICSEGVHQTYPASNGIDACVGVLGVSVGEVAQVDACRQLPSCRQLPVQQESQIDIGIDLRTDDLITVIIVFIIRMPPE